VQVFQDTMRAPDLRTLADFATEATFTIPHGDEDRFGRRLWRNAEYYQANYLCLLLTGVGVSFILEGLPLLRLAGLGVAAVLLGVALLWQGGGAALPTAEGAQRALASALSTLACALGPVRTDGRPEPTAAVAAAILLSLLGLGVVFSALGLRWAFWCLVLVTAHLLARKPNSKSKASFVMNAVKGLVKAPTPVEALAQMAASTASR
jgi:hypothetical protein